MAILSINAYFVYNFKIKKKLKSLDIMTILSINAYFVYNFKIKKKLKSKYFNRLDTY